MEDIKTKKTAKKSTSFDYPREMRDLCGNMEIALRNLTSQIAKIDPVDDIGEHLTNNKAYIDALVLLNT